MKNSKYKEQWSNYFEGDIEIWSYFGYQYHSYLITKHIVPLLSIPKTGKLIQLGTGLGITVELLCNLYGEHRTLGYDLFNPLYHPNIHFLDITKEMPPASKIAYLEIDVGSMNHFEEKRMDILLWALNNMVNNGYILTNRKLVSKLKIERYNNFEIINLKEFDIPELWKNVHQSRLDTKTILKVKNRDI